MVEHTSQVDSEVVMLDAFQRRAGELLGQEAVFTKEKGVIKVGLEVEYSLLDQNLRQVEESCRNRIVDENLEFLAPELGASQIELRTPPILLLENSGFRSVNATLVERQGCIETSAHEQGIQVLCSGTNPFIPLNEVVRSDKTKYQLVPNFHNDRRDGVVTCLGTEGLDIGDAAVVGLLNSVQANIEATNFYDAVDKLNRSFMISPMAVALTANARFLDLRDSSFNDVRMIAWERSHDTRNQIERELGIPTRVGLPARYCRDFADYLNCVSSYPFILDNPDHALEVGIGLFWRDARIKIIGNSAVVEFRPVSTQRSPELNTAAMAFYVGRLLWSQTHNEPLLPMNLVKENKDQAMQHGIHAKLWTICESSVIRASAQAVLPLEINKALEGLEKAGFPDMTWHKELLSLLKENITDTPTERLFSNVKESRNRKESLANGLFKK